MKGSCSHQLSEHVNFGSGSGADWPQAATCAWKSHVHRENVLGVLEFWKFKGCWILCFIYYLLLPEDSVLLFHIALRIVNELFLWSCASITHRIMSVSSKLGVRNYKLVQVSINIIKLFGTSKEFLISSSCFNQVFTIRSIYQIKNKWNPKVTPSYQNNYL